MTIETTNVLIFPGGTENGLEIYKSLKDCKKIALFSACSSVSNHAPFVFKENVIIPSVKENDWVLELNKLITQWSINFIYPANSLVIDKLIDNRDNIKCPLLLPNSEVVALTRSKKKTLKALSDLISVPVVYDDPNSIQSFPCFTKPDKGYGSQGNIKLENKSQAQEFFQNKKTDDYILQEYLPGKEFTIDCFSNNEGDLLFCSGRERERIRMGTSMRARRASDELNKTFDGIANIILSKISITGAWFFQMKEDAQGKLKILEIDIRIAGTMCLNRVYGVNFPALTLFQHMGQNVDILQNDLDITLDRALVNRYQSNLSYNVVYVDLDDTLIIRGKINTDLIKFIYQSLNNSKKLILISKSLANDKVQILRDFKIHDLFSEVIWLTEDQSKADFISHKDAIFIDDSFSQRKLVAQKCAIPTFDCSMIEFLISDRV